MRLLVSLILTLGVVGIAQADFNDVIGAHPHHEAINYVQNQGIVSGYGDGTYRPENTINRAEFVKIVAEAQFDRDDIESCVDLPFPDVPAGQWFTKYVCMAWDEGVIGGYPDGTFQPGRTISFAEAAKVIAESFGLGGAANEIWYRPYVEKLEENKAIPTTITSFEKEITRGEMAEMIYRLKADVKHKPSKTYLRIAGGDADQLNPRSSRSISETNGEKHSIPLESVVGGGPPKDGIPSIDNPKFISISEADELFDDEGLGIGVSLNGIDRFYPNQILVYHEIVNDWFGQDPVVVTYCPLCGTGIVFDARVDGDRTEFGTSGNLWNSNLLMYDRTTDSVWSQVLGEAVVGELTGALLNKIPHDNLLYKDWKASHPNGQVLSTDTGHSRDYNRDPYGNYYNDERLFFVVDNESDRFHPKEPAWGVEVNGVYKVYAQVELDQSPASFSDEVGGVTLNIEYNSATNTIDIRRVDNGQEVVPTYGFWFSWYSVHPNAEVYEKQ